MSEENDSGITGRGTMRDRYILCNALAYAITVIGRLPIERQEASNANDMKLMLNHLTKGFVPAKHFMEGAIWHLDGLKEKR